METRSTDKRVWTWVSEDGKHAAAGMNMGPGIGMKPGGHEKEQPFSLGNGQYVLRQAVDPHVRSASDAEGLSGGSEVRGKATPPQKSKYPPPPPAPKEPHLTYSIEGHALRNPEGDVISDADTYSGKGQHRNKAASQDVEDFGPIPEGNWRIEEITDPKYYENHPKLHPPVFRLIPDEATEKRIGKDGMGRNPGTFLIHGNNKENDASRGCLILNKSIRIKLKDYEGGWLRVTR